MELFIYAIFWSCQTQWNWSSSCFATARMHIDWKLVVISVINVAFETGSVSLKDISLTWLPIMNSIKNELSSQTVEYVRQRRIHYFIQLQMMKKTNLIWNLFEPCNFKRRLTVLPYHSFVIIRMTREVGLMRENTWKRHNTKNLDKI